ncbi:GspE/PulE family protein [Aliidiomarina haloalkalitolerans]|uniref:Type II/IV secretion system protein n=1 Tax=Aliidiomarina haloalkalitolerans TaxID=859059 RepID=A0A432VSV1_9GAMM|nr:ATPase, T2SS/T4P/T4SS family [Aliidiomarina haloalkalitolerans]MCL4408830.1 Flp pilus assembly complex ATPase component TadA [Gammaproteobacteria bacterium]RUO19499.1 type II/IV secretion system protein [Aliidiomarina haloalkalitolerans]
MHQLPETLGQFIAQHALNQCSDLHLEAQQDGYRWRARRLGQMHQLDSISVDEGRRLIAAMKSAAGLDTTERVRPQDGRFDFAVFDEAVQVDCRLNTVATLHGEKLVIRVQVLAAGNLPLDELGLLPSQLAAMRAASQAEHGLILVTGATGSGKTRTLYALLQAITGEQKNIVTVEDPVEMALTGINQVPVNHAQSLDFAKILRALLRQDPDVIMIGEIRDAETAQIACQAAQTGHLVLATLHASNALSAFVRLQQLGVDYYQLAACLLMLSCQQLETHGERRQARFQLLPRQTQLINTLLAHQQDDFWPNLAALCRNKEVSTQPSLVREHVMVRKHG